jgi:cytochrome c551/c552
MRKKIMISVSILLLTLYVFSIPPVEEGKMIFTTRCASCHNVNKVIVGPALAGVADRRSEDWIIHFVHSSQTVLKGGDQIATDLYEKYNKIPMPDHPDLSADNIRSILVYIKVETNKTSERTQFRPDKRHPAFTPINLTNWTFFSGYLALILLLAASMVLLVRVKEIQRKESDKL